MVREVWALAEKAIYLEGANEPKVRSAEGGICFQTWKPISRRLYKLSLRYQNLPSMVDSKDSVSIREQGSSPKFQRVSYGPREQEKNNLASDPKQELIHLGATP